MTDAPRIPLLVRPLSEGDRPFLFSAWLHVMRHAPSMQGVPDRVYFPAQRELISRILSRAMSLVACDPADAAHLYGCIVATPGLDAVHWLYVKSAYRMLGIARALVQTAFERTERFWCTQMSAWDFRASMELHQIVYAPHLLFDIQPPPMNDVWPDPSPSKSLSA